MVEIPDPPDDLQEGGRRLWRSVVEVFQLAEHERVLLVEAARCTDELNRLRAIIVEEDVLDPATGRAHAALVEARQLRITLARTLAALRVPSGDEDSAQPQRRAGVRGPYALAGGPARPRVIA